MIELNDLTKSANFSKENIRKFINLLCVGILIISVAILICHIHKPIPRIGSVNITGIIDGFIKEQTKAQVPAQEIKKRVQAFGGALENELHALSQKENLVLLPSEAVIAGAHDYTAVIQTRCLNAYRKT